MNNWMDDSSVRANSRSGHETRSGSVNILEGRARILGSWVLHVAFTRTSRTYPLVGSYEYGNRRFQGTRFERSSRISSMKDSNDVLTTILTKSL
jgi:hypothetical protein